jgi:urea transport system ATP-binding protein
MSKELLHVENLSVSFDGFKALNVEYFSLRENELRVVIGPNGAGKTTFMDVLCGKTKPDTGKAEMDGVDLTHLDEREIVEAGVGRKFQTPTIFPSLSVFDNLRLAHRSGRGVFASLFQRLSQQVRDDIHRTAQTIGLHDKLHQEAAYLSHGQKQWLEIGMLIVQDPKLLLIDEPAAGMSDEETAKTGELLIEMSSQRSIIVIEHDMEFVKQLGSLVTVLCEGQVLTEGTMEKVQNDPKVIEQYLGRAKSTEKAPAVENAGAEHA